MQITKLVHSCLLVESKGNRILIDPGVYSWQSGTIRAEFLSNIDAVAVTHIHPDHLHEDFAKAIKTASPDATWYGPSQVIAKLTEWDIAGFSSSNNTDIKFITSKHADISPWVNEQPEHTSFLLFEDLLIGGDCHTLTESHGARIFGAAINGGPWGGVVGFAKMIEAMTDRPQAIIPLHDWHFNDDARQAIYAKLPDVLSSFKVDFAPLENGIGKKI